MHAYTLTVTNEAGEEVDGFTVYAADGDTTKAVDEIREFTVASVPYVPDCPECEGTGCERIGRDHEGECYCEDCGGTGKVEIEEMSE